VLNLEQIQSLLSFLAGSRFEALYYLELTTGLREGELLGLKWSDLDWTTSKLMVQRQVQHIPHEGLQLVEPKSRAGRRAITLGYQALEKLREYNKLQQKVRQFAGDRWKENEKHSHIQECFFIIPPYIGDPGAARTPNLLIKSWRTNVLYPARGGIESIMSICGGLRCR
jgi:integrase